MLCCVYLSHFRTEYTDMLCAPQAVSYRARFPSCWSGNGQWQCLESKIIFSFIVHRMGGGPHCSILSLAPVLQF